MKRIALFFTTMLLLATTVNATTTTLEDTNMHHNYVRGYGNSFIFTESGIEFSIFPDGQFDFYMPNCGPDVSVGFNSPNVSISFNTGYDYNPFVQYDDFGAIVQIENVPIFYDYYGRITRAGNVNIYYNSFGRISRVGGLYVHYRNRAFSHCSGFINVYNRAYVYRPWHRFYVIPAIDFCILSPRPYRQYYAPVRHAYYRPYRNNYRQPVRVNGRRGALAQNDGRRNTTRSRVSDRYKQEATPRRDGTTKGKSRNDQSLANNSRTRTIKSTPRTVKETRTIKSNPRTVKPNRTIKSTPRRNVTKPKTRVSNTIKTRPNRTVNKPKTSRSRTYNKSSRSSQRMTQTRKKQKSYSKSTQRTTKQRSARGNSRRTRA